ncbi:MAG: AmmeMemoRadiSam system protein B [Deltaproteobacteria bacterium]|nr:AmmeMemoRadiSam system protein B [Deltaproteobacteria bacterium]MBW1961282.1 AmmeMemoRadiSam system protein B [Deltaproteobacteria bacterium]MBW2152718.1 AmmeMemoRadiSam system protein B [Deltaproteobacteria bacterium]
MKVRKAVYSGNWYPATARECEKEIKAFLKETKVPCETDLRKVSGIVPHAGWYFSGKIACNVIRCLAADSMPDAIVVFGMHLHPDSANYIMKEGAWQTPFGELEIQHEISGELVKEFKFKIETPDDFTPDNTIELQLPFIKYFFEGAKLVPIGVPPSERSLRIGQSVVEIARRLGLTLKVLGSTDLTHYGYNYGFTPKGTGPEAVDWVKNQNDRRVIEALLAMDPERVIREAMANQNACCAGAAATAVAAGKALGATCGKIMAYATSYDKSPGDSFVGYVGIVF